MYRRRFVVLGAWVATLVALAALAIGLGSAFTDSSNLPKSDSATAARLLASTESGTDQGVIVWHTTGTAVDSPAVQKEFASVLKQIAAMPGVTAVSSPYDKADQLNKTAGTAYATVTVTDKADTDAIIARAETLRSSNVQVEAGGDAFAAPIGASHIVEIVGLAAALIILLLVFRSGWAAALPIVTGVVGVASSLLAVVLVSHLIDLSSNSITMGSLIGLGVGIDYALFILNRYRKALQAGASVPEAIGRAVATSGRAVVFAGLTVMVALLGMVVVDLRILTGMAEAAALTVLFTVVAATTLLPALLGILGRRVLPKRPRKTKAHAGKWAALVQRFPVPAVALALAAVVAVALPVTSMRVGDADSSSDPADSSSHTYYTVMADAFGAGFDAPLTLVSPSSKADFTQLLANVAELDGVAHVSTATAVGNVEVATVTPTTSAQSAATADLVKTLRSMTPHAYVGGETAMSIDLADALLGKLPLYLGLIAVLGFLLLAVAFRSLLVPLVGAISNLASIVVGLGVVTAIFQHGWGSQLLGVGSGAPINYLVPVMVVGITFGLSMDYQVFLVSRMHEEWSHTRDHHRSVRVGVTETAQVILVAAAIMLSVFASFGFSGQRIVAEIGIGLASAVLMDALVVRLTLMPAVLTLIGRRSWYFPRWADRVTPHVSVEGPAEEEARVPEAIAA